MDFGFGKHCMHSYFRWLNQLSLPGDRKKYIYIYICIFRKKSIKWWKSSGFRRNKVFSPPAISSIKHRITVNIEWFSETEIMGFVVMHFEIFENISIEWILWKPTHNRDTYTIFFSYSNDKWNETPFGVFSSSVMMVFCINGIYWNHKKVKREQVEQNRYAQYWIIRLSLMGEPNTLV